MRQILNWQPILLSIVQVVSFVYESRRLEHLCVHTSLLSLHDSFVWMIIASLGRERSAEHAQASCEYIFKAQNVKKKRRVACRCKPRSYHIRVWSISARSKNIRVHKKKPRLVYNTSTFIHRSFVLSILRWNFHSPANLESTETAMLSSRSFLDYWVF